MFPFANRATVALKALLGVAGSAKCADHTVTQLAPEETSRGLLVANPDQPANNQNSVMVAVDGPVPERVVHVNMATTSSGTWIRASGNSDASDISFSSGD